MLAGDLLKRWGGIVGDMNEIRYRYTAIDGSVVRGTASEVGEQLSDWHGEGASAMPAPWQILGEDGDTAPRECSRDELVEWIAQAEGRPEDEVYEALVED